MKKAMIVQPMKGRTEEEIVATRNMAIELLESNGYEVVDSPLLRDIYNKKGVVDVPLYLLALTLEAMSFSNMVYFCDGCMYDAWCRLVHKMAKDYGVKVIYGGVLSNLKTGDKVRFTNGRLHNKYYDVFPKVGTIGTIVDVEDLDTVGYVIIQWPKGSTSKDDQWGAYVEDLERVEAGGREMEFEVGMLVRFLDEEQHVKAPYLNPPVGTVGVVSRIYDDVGIKASVQVCWPEGVTFLRKWSYYPYQLEIVEEDEE